MRAKGRSILAISVDLDGTLAVAGWRKLGMVPSLFRARGALSALLSAIQAQRGQRAPQLDAMLIAAASQRCGAPQAAVRAVLHEELDGRFARLLRTAPAAANVLELLAAADRAGVPRVVFSDHPALQKLDVRGMQDGWAAVIAARPLGALKPCPDGLWAAASLLGVAPSQMLHIGDRWDTDGQAAARAGAMFAHIEELDWWRARIVTNSSDP